MKLVLKIAKAELNLLFFSPIAWALLIVFLFQAGFAYTNILGFPIMSNENSAGNDFSTPLTWFIFTNQGMGLMPAMASKVYLYMPLLTMGLISREVSSGTIKLLYSSPIKVHQLVLGKFIAMMGYCLLMIGILSLFMISGITIIRSADWGLMLACLLGMYLLLCAYASIGLFMSCLSSYQVIAALSTFILLALMSYIGTVWQNIDFVRDLTYYLSISGRVEHFFAGLITTKDLFYFILVVCMFLSFSILKLQASKQSKSIMYRSGKYIFVVAMVLCIGYISSNPYLTAYWDLTATKKETLTDASQQIIRKLGHEPIEITSFINVLDDYGRFAMGLPTQRNADLARWDPYIRFIPNLNLKYVYYYDMDTIVNPNLYKDKPGTSLKQMAQSLVRDMDFSSVKSPEEIRKIADLRGEGYRYTMQIQYKGKKRFLRLFNDSMIFPSEQEIATALKLLTEPSPKIYFLQGELERNLYKAGDKDYQNTTTLISQRSALVNQGFDIDTISLNGRNIPSDASVLVIADPKSKFTTKVLDRINEFINKGGNLMILGEPQKQGIINPLISPLGIKLLDGMVIEKSKDFSPELAMPHWTQSAVSMSGYRNIGPAGDTTRLMVTMPGAAALHLNHNAGYKVKPLLITSKDSWDRKEKLIADSPNVSFNAGDIKGPLITMVSLTKKINGREQRIIVGGDADFLSNAEIGGHIGISNSNFDFRTNLFKWLVYNKFPLNIEPRPTYDTKLNLLMPGLMKLKIFFLGIFPGILIVCAGVFLIIRKRK